MVMLYTQQQPTAQQATNKVSRDLSNLNAEMDQQQMTQKLQQLIRQPHPSLELIQQLLMKKELQPELFHQLLQQPQIQQPQIQQAQKQLKAAVAAGTGAANAAGKKAKKTGPPPAALPHPPSALATADAKGGDGTCCTHHHHQHQHAASCGHDVTTCVNAHCHHGSRPSTPYTAVLSPADPAAAASFPPLYLTVDVDAQTESNHDTALTLACAGGHADLVRLLLTAQCPA
jgi:ankyrin repeat protein